MITEDDLLTLGFVKLTTGYDPNKQFFSLILSSEPDSEVEITYDGKTTMSNYRW